MTQLSRVIDSFDGAAVVIETAGDSCRTSSAFEFLYGTTPENQTELLDLLTADPTSRGQLEAAFEDARTGSESVVAISKLGTLKVAGEITVGPIGDADYGDLLVLVDCPLLETRLRDLAARRERLFTLGQLSAGVIHEFNNVLTAILGWTQIALRDPMRLETVDSALSIIDENCQRAKHIIDDLMGFVRNSAGDAETIQLQKVADDVLRVLSWELNNAAITVNRSYRAVPSVRADRREMFQVILNLVLNSLRAMPDGGEITVSLRSDEDRVLFEFKDTGHGMDEETVERVFDPLFSTSNEGAGLGLAICRRVVEEHKGEISVSSRPGEGATFLISLPGHGSRHSTPPETLPEPDAPPSGMDILVIEDEKDVRRMIVKALEGSDMFVTSVSSGVEALAMCRRHDYDAVLLDANMPAVSAPFLAGKIREILSGVRIIALTGRADSLNREETGADEILRKPFVLDDLYDVLKKDA